jgi:MraZ protein
VGFPTATWVAHGRALLTSDGPWMGSIFQGRFEVRIDAKGRLILPNSWRSSSSLATLVFASSIYRRRPFLDVYTPEEWFKLVNQIQLLPDLKPEVQAFKRFYISGGQHVDCDSQGRFLMPRTLRTQASIESDALLVGMNHKFEIWNLKDWDFVYSEMTENFEKLLGEISITSSLSPIPPRDGENK